MLGLPYSSFPMPCAASDSSLHRISALTESSMTKQVLCRKDSFFVQCDGCFVGGGGGGGGGCSVKVVIQMGGRKSLGILIS